MTAPVQLELLHLTFAVTRAGANPRHADILGEVEICLDGEDTAWVTPSAHLEVTDEVLDRVADKLRAEGVVWMRGWGYGGRQGRVITANGPVTTLPPRDYSFLDEGD